MPFCASCGAPVEGRFCAKCGASMPAAGSEPGAGAPPPNPQPAYSAPPTPQPAVASSGMEDNVAGALCYLLGFITGIIFLVLDPYNKKPFVRFHAFQSIFLNVALIAINIALSIFGVILHSAIISLLLLPVWMLFGLVVFGLWLFCMYKAYNREWFQIPVIGPIALRQSGASQ